MALLSAAGKNLKLSPVRRKDTGRRRRFALRGRLRGSGPAALGYLSRVDAMRDAMCTGLALKREDRRKTSRGLP